jgi:hypothetical protein
LTEDVVTARLNLRSFIAKWPYEPEDLRADNGPVLVAAVLPRAQHACDAHSPAGVRAVGLPQTYPFDSKGAVVAHELCQPIGAQAKRQSLRGVRARSACVPEGAGRELAWFPATARSRAKRLRALRFADWYWS